MMFEENLEQAKVHQQCVASISLMAETKVAAASLVELVDVTKTDEIIPAGPGIQRLKLLVLERRHPRHGLENVAANEGIRSPSPNMGHRVGQGLDTVGNDEPARGGTSGTDGLKPCALILKMQSEMGMGLPEHR